MYSNNLNWAFVYNSNTYIETVRYYCKVRNVLRA